MRMSKKKEIVPKFRFPEFQRDGIDFVHGNKLFKSITNKNHNSNLPILAITQDQGAVPRDQIEYNVTVTDKSLSNYKVVEVGDFIISLRSFQGGIEYSRFKGICSPAYIILRKREENISELYYKYFFKTWRYIQSLNRNLEGIRDGKMISYSQFSSVKVPYHLIDMASELGRPALAAQFMALLGGNPLPRKKWEIPYQDFEALLASL